jgi:hypothetical protein
VGRQLNGFFGAKRGKKRGVQLHKVIRKRIRRTDGGSNLVGDVQAVIAGNIGESGSSHVSVSSRQDIVQDSGRSTRRNTTQEDARERTRER